MTFFWWLLYAVFLTVFLDDDPRKELFDDAKNALLCGQKELDDLIRELL